MSPSTARAKEIKRTPFTNNLFDSDFLQSAGEKADMERKYINNDKSKCKKHEITPLFSEVGGGTNIQASLLSTMQS